MTRKIPPLNALKSFEAAARHLSFTKSAEELHVTQAAVSHQVRSLEEFLGVTLFTRAHQSLNLTDAGKAILPKLSDALDLIEESYQDLYAESQTVRLNIKAPSTFTQRWLLRYIGEYQTHHPNVDIRLSAIDNDTDFFPDAFDLEIRYEIGECDAENAHLIFTEQVFPVCHPSFLQGEKAIKTPSDLTQHRLLHINLYPEDWAMWLRSANVTDIDPAKGYRFDQTSLTMEAAMNQLGVALGRSPVIDGILEKGELVEPFNHRIQSRGGYWLIVKNDLSGRLAHVSDFKDWILHIGGEK
ncbi:transcriptional regulator GcvA [Parasalinivibrio latis]|uniref:transcriptional regulator GcvA n=1 Tax=Parasalinivibrio latis TaxID=2952610 RepID=UPI0030E53C42